MTHYVVGDLQGCLAPLQQLLSRLSFKPSHDHIIFCGDLVNRGPQSLETLRFVRTLGSAATCLLGNHDLHLLAAAHTGHLGRKDTLDEILQAPDADALLDWLRIQPLAWHSAPHEALVIHAGVPPQWDVAQTLACALEVQHYLSGKKARALLNDLYGDDPDLWSDRLKGIPRLRFIINALTRLRYCDAEGRLHLKPKGAPGTQPKELMPWFEVPNRRTANDTIIFGHWSTLGQVHWPQAHVYGLDTGCVWGGCLTALNLDTRRLVRVNCESYRQPGLDKD